MRADMHGGSSDPVVIHPDQSPSGGSRALFTWLTGHAAVPMNHVGIVRRLFGPADPDFMSITPHDYRGWQARTLLPGRTTQLSPGRYKVEVVPRIYVPEGMIGLVTAKDGAERPNGQRLGRYVKCDNFQDGRAFLLNGGQQGRQVATLAGSHYYRINPRLFGVEFVPRVRVPAGTIGLVIALDGKVPGQDRRFARHVECDHFQNGHAFLEGGGEQGRQLAVLRGGTSYDINPALFAVITKDNAAWAATQDGLTAEHLKEFTIPTGKTGVVLTLDGKLGKAKTVAPRVDGHQGFRLPWAFLDGGGCQGVQEQTLGEGTTCALNPWFARVVTIPTKVLILEWSKTPDQKAGNYDSQLSRITVTVQGHQVHMELSQTLTIPEKAAPRLVTAFGDQMGSTPIGGLVEDPAPVQRFVEKVLGATVKGYINGMAASGSVQEFLGRYNDARRELADKVGAELEYWEVEPGSTSLGSFEADDPKLNKELQDAASAEALGKVLAFQEENAEREARIFETLLERKLMEADPKLWAEVKALGAERVALVQMTEAISKSSVPEILNTSGADLGDVLPLHVLREFISSSRGKRRKRLNRGQDSDSGKIADGSQPVPDDDGSG